MESYISPEFLAAADPKQLQHQQDQQLLQATANFDFLSFTSPSDVLAPHPDLFESELDSSLAGFDPLQLQSILLDQSFDFLQNDIASCGPPSTITVSTESVSAYESLSGQADSLYGYTPSNYSFPLDLDMDFSRATLNSHQDYAANAAGQRTASHVHTDNRSDYMYSGGSMYSSSSSNSPNDFADELDAYSANLSSPSPGAQGGSVYSDYGSSQYNPVGSNHPSLRSIGSVSPGMMSMQQAQVSPPQIQVQPPLGRAPSPIGTGLNMSLLPNISRSETAYRRSPESHVSFSSMEHIQPERREEKGGHFCPQCNKRFGRKYNMKSHLETHDPVRVKKFPCESCQRSFSRKHDLHRHYLSIHNVSKPPLGDSTTPDAEGPRIGLATLIKHERCAGCGASERQCSCDGDNDVE